jgi:hypothetical protein
MWRRYSARVIALQDGATTNAPGAQTTTIIANIKNHRFIVGVTSFLGGT